MYKSFAWRMAIVSSQVMADQVGGGVDDTPIDRSARRLERMAETDVELMAMMNTDLVQASGPLIETEPAIGSFSRREGFEDSTVPALQCDHRGDGRCRARGEMEMVMEMDDQRKGAEGAKGGGGVDTDTDCDTDGGSADAFESVIHCISRDDGCERDWDFRRHGGQKRSEYQRKDAEKNGEVPPICGQSRL